MVDKHVGLGAKSRAGHAEGHCHPFSSNTPISRPDTLFAPFNPFPNQAHLPSSFVSDDVGSSSIPSSPFTYERASGGSRSVDAITSALSRQHLHNDSQNSLVEIPASNFASLATPSPMAEDAPQHSPLLQDTATASLSLESRPHAATLRLPDPPSCPPPQQDTQYADKHHSVGTNDSTRLWQKIPSKYSQVLNKNEAIQTLLESMICSETQCNVQTSSMPAPSTRGQQGPCPTGNETALVVDEIMTDNMDLEAPLLDKIMAARCGIKSAGISKSSLPGYRSSTETALRCRNLVRSKPRMRKRTKMREQSSSSAMPSAARPTVASAATAS